MLKVYYWLYVILLLLKDTKKIIEFEVKNIQIYFLNKTIGIIFCENISRNVLSLLLLS